MAQDEDKIVVDVPPGYAPMSTPTDPATRFSKGDIVLSRAKETDLLDMADGMHTCFPEVWWTRHEPLSIRAPPELRRARQAKRLAPMLRYPHFQAIKASLRSTGEFVGFAGWLVPNEHIYRACGGRLLSVFRHDAAKDEPEGLGFAKLMGWSAKEVDEMWKDVDLESWEKEFRSNDKVRTEEMGATPHWYLAPFFVLEKFRGRGVGRLLLDYATEQADAQTPATPTYLEALPNARPVYMHCGFEPQQGPDRGMVLIRNKSKARV